MSFLLGLVVNKTRSLSFILLHSELLNLSIKKSVSIINTRILIVYNFVKQKWEKLKYLKKINFKKSN